MSGPETGNKPVQYDAHSRESVADIVMNERGESRRLKVSAVAALLVHFVLLAAVIPLTTRVFDVEAREATVIRRYKPPKPPEITKPVHKRIARRVPIPDATPFVPEPLLDEEREFVHTERADTAFVIHAPVGPPDPLVVQDALDIAADGLAPPRLVRRVPPKYDPDRARRGVQGKVDLQIVIAATGLVEFARVINGTEDEELDRRALEAVQLWEFEPAMMDGQAVSVRAMVTINYRIY